MSSKIMTLAILKVLTEQAEKGDLVIDYFSPSPYSPRGEMYNLTLITQEAYQSKKAEESLPMGWEPGGFSFPSKVKFFSSPEEIVEHLKKEVGQKEDDPWESHKKKDLLDPN